jgi:hypothetical protein
MRCFRHEDTDEVFSPFIVSYLFVHSISLERAKRTASAPAAAAAAAAAYDFNSYPHCS